MDYYFAPVVDRRIHGWHANLGVVMQTRLGADLSVALGYTNRVDPYMLGYAERGWSSVSPMQVLLQNVPELHLLLSLSLQHRK
jgi:hypothetical protein